MCLISSFCSWIWERCREYMWTAVRPDMLGHVSRRQGESDKKDAAIQTNYLTWITGLLAHKNCRKRRNLYKETMFIIRYFQVMFESRHNLGALFDAFLSSHPHLTIIKS